MADPITLEERVVALEQELAELKQRLEPVSAAADWIEQIAGSMADYPEFDEVARLGAQFRRSQEPANGP